MLQGMEVVNELEEKFTLQELVERSVSNPRNRRAELMVRIAGLEQAARQRGHAGLFFHLTCPSRMHRAYFDSGRRNRRYDRTTPREAQRYLCKQWEKARAKLFRKGIRPYGFRVVEPHHDGTPHWHLLLFVPREHQEQLCQILKHYALQADGDEQGADERRLTVMPIDWELGTAAGYIAKYISKNIDGHGIDVDQYGHDAKKVAERIVTWASLWGIRQFQQIGGPPVTVWRELRRLCPEDVIGHLQGAVAAADEADWARFTELMGGPDAPRKKHPIKLHKAWNDALGRYGEPIGERIYGVECDSVITVTRVHTWKTRPASGPPNLHPVLEHGVGGRGNGSGGSPGPRVAAPGS
jgi:hypothetical protein